MFQGSLKLLNVKTGALIHDFATTFTSAITVVSQSTALDVVAVGCESGEIALVNLKFDEMLFRLRQDWPVTAIAFRFVHFFMPLIFENCDILGGVLFSSRLRSLFPCQQ